MSRPNTPTYKTLNWPAYNKALKRRGSLSIWFDADMAWAAKPIASVTADGAYDTRKCHDSIAKRGAAPVIPPPQECETLEGRQCRCSRA
jgi:hypothetical protein